MEHLLEIIVIAQCVVVLWLSSKARELDADLDNFIDAHNRLSEAFVELVTALDEGKYDD